MGTWGNFGETRGGVEKSGVLEHKKVAISLKRVKIDEKLLWRAYNSPTLFRTVPSPTPYGLLFPRLGVRNPNPKLQSLLSQERVKLRTSNLTGNFTGSISSKAHKNLGEKTAWMYPGIAKIFFEYPLLSQKRVKLRTSEFCTRIQDLK